MAQVDRIMAAEYRYAKRPPQKEYRFTTEYRVDTLQQQVDDLPDIVQSDWNTQDVDDMSYIKNKPNVPILDQSGQIPASYLPSYVDDILEYSSFHDLPQPGEPGKIYVTTDNDLTYRWSGTTYIEISKSIITGVKGDAETDYRIGNVNLTAANIGLGNVVNLDQSKAIKGITRNGLTFTYTCLDGTTGTFDQQDNNTTYSAGTGLSLTNTTFALALTKKLVTDALGYTPPTTDHTYNFSGVSFTSGQSDTGEHDANKITSNGVWYYTSNGPATTLGASTTDGALYSQAYSTALVGQIAQDYRNGRLFVRGKNNNAWQNWLRVALYSEIPTTLPASDVYAWAKASTKPSYTLDEVSDGSTRKLANYLPLAGGTMTGALAVKQFIFGYNYNHAGSNAPAFVFNKPGSNYTGIGSHSTTDTIWFGAATLSNGEASWVDTYKQKWVFNGTVTADNFYGNVTGNLTGNADTATNADTVDDLHASNLVRFFLSPMTGGAPADSAKSWFTNTMPSASGAIVYNVPGSEKTIIAGKSSGSYGHMLQLNYDDTYLRILRYRGGSWQSTDWEKISAGYADSAGSVSWSNVTEKPSTFTPSSHTHSYLPLSGGTVTGRLVVNATSSPSRLVLTSVNSTGHGVIDFTEDVNGQTHHFQIQDKCVTGVSTVDRFLIFHVDGSGSAISIQKGATPTIGIGGKNDLYTGGAGVLYVYGAASATAWNTHSDIRSKDIKEDANISVETIANAPLFYFYWKNKQDEDKHVGTSAQYWQKVLPEVITGNDKVRLHMDYSVAALTSAITIAREVVKQDKKIKQLEEENKQLKEELQLLKSQINDILTTINKSTNNK